ncbi:MAG TPA: uracil-DNA glycosylase family protein [Gaiellaceae bacterium]|nr:uracil-DNA glycosylase family protein [Gaiellaceae bacterium]
MPADDISERYLKKAIAEINDLGREIAQAAGPDRTPVLGSGHPQADILLLKYGPQDAEQHEGVAFFGRAGQAILKSLQRLHVDPMAIYGTNCLKFGGADEEQAGAWLAREIHIVQPKLIVAMGQDALGCLNAIRFPLSAEVTSEPGVIQRFTPTIEALVCPDVDASLDETAAKRAFWDAFKAIGPWWSELPPY